MPIILKGKEQIKRRLLKKTFVMFDPDNNVINIEDSPEHTSKKSPSLSELNVVKNILNEAGLTNYEPGVLNQLLYMTYSHVTNILEDAVLFSKHADKSALDTKDVMLAIRVNKNKRPFNRNKRKDALDLAQEINSEPLPDIPTANGLRLPPEKYCLLNSKYNLKRAEKPQERSHFFSYPHPNQLASVLLHPSNISQEMYARTLLKRPQKMPNAPQKIVFRPNLQFNHNQNNMEQHLKRRRDLN